MARLEQGGDAVLVPLVAAVAPACTARFSTPERADWAAPGVAGSSPAPPARRF